ncbi:sensor histidine kinase [Qaidamihabitans albus]|uniref:sensor histidine kinase n=1 Tax=Qaidamihabitans albus TaxID=2795733 RepID=UPI0018F10EC3|nr:nitrate- and nitrite sensing domain-containing protein [Qaidamihabitans albus]
MPVGKLLGQQPPRPPKWRAVVRWRDWSLPVKLGAVTLVPIVIALVLGAITMSNQVNRADRYERIDRLVALDTSVRTLVDGLQRERTQTAELLTEGLGAGNPELDAVRGEVDRAVEPVTAAAARAAELQGGIDGPRTQVTEQLGRLADLRERVGSGQVDPVEAITEYSAVTSALLDLDTALVAGISDEEIGGSAAALHDLLVAKEAVTVQQALVGYGIARGGLAPSELNELRTYDVRLTDRIEEFRTAATPGQRQDFESTVLGDAFDNRDRIVKAALAEQGTGGDDALGSVSAQQWTDASSAVFSGLGEVGSRLGEQLTAQSGELADGAGTGAGVLAVLLFVALLLAAAVVFLITRQLLRSLKLLRTSALEVAQTELPTAVRNIQEGRSQSTEIRPVPVETGEEIGEVARAFDAVHSEALRLAVEQAAMRTGYASVFVNLSRRSQSLVQRQLQLIERLERDEEDADQLATLFQLDHLATRMRRNNENLMVLSGAEPGRRSGQPVTATDVLRAAVSEIEQYQRVVVRTPPPVRVVGYAASDLMRLIAELLDNATAFSAPETQVTVVTRLADDRSLSIDILDKGIGMNESEVTEANARLAEAASVDLATSRRMGLFVVGRLASRHGFGVSLHGGKDIVGVRATVTVRAELVMDQAQPQGQPGQPSGLGQPPQAQALPPGMAERQQPVPSQGGGPLPRRQRPPNGVSRPGALADLAGQSSPPSQGSEVERRLAGGSPQEPPLTDNEITGTALFSPIGREDTGQQAPPKSPESPKSSQPPELPKRQGSPLPPQRQTGQRPEPGAADEGPRWPSGEDVAAPAPRQGERTEQPEPQGADGGAPSEAGQAAPDEEVLPSGKQLFEATGTAVSDWWSAATTASDAERRARKAAVDNAETTPIFDEMLSVWFRSNTPPPPDQARPEAAGAKKAKDANNAGDAGDAGDAGEAGDAGDTAANSPWDFAVDESWRTVQAVSQAAPSDYTPAGLPRRRRGEKLLPGSAVPQGGGAATGEKPAAAEPNRDPADVRGRLSSFQQGVSRGRRDSGGESATAPASGSGLPQRQPRKPQQRPEQQRPERSADDAGEGATAGSDWTFATDDRWRTVQSVSGAAPSDYTSAGLPRRRRGEKLLPGSAATPSSTAEDRRPRTERDPADVRGRLNSFQQGIRRGRHRTGQATEGNEEKVEGE